jgi:hypothetical protein
MTYMLSGMIIYTTNNLWRQILTDLGAAVTDDSNVADINFDSLAIPDHTTSIELKSKLLNTIANNQREIIKKVFNKDVVLSKLQMKLVVLLSKTGGISMDYLKSVLGYSPDVATHTIDTAIYELRKAYGRDFIKNQNGKYFIG